MGSDPGTLEGHSFGSTSAADKSANGSVVNTDHRKASKISKNASGSKQPTIEEPKAKASWSEHVWSKFAWIHLFPRGAGHLRPIQLFTDKIRQGYDIELTNDQFIIDLTRLSFTIDPPAQTALNYPGFESKGMANNDA